MWIKVNRFFEIGRLLCINAYICSFKLLVLWVHDKVNKGYTTLGDCGLKYGSRLTRLIKLVDNDVMHCFMQLYI